MRRGERNLIPTRPTSTPLEMTATEKAFVALFDFVFTKIAFTYAPRTKIKQIRKCVSSTSSDLPRQWYNPLPLSHGTVYVLSRTCDFVRAPSALVLFLLVTSLTQIARILIIFTKWYIYFYLKWYYKKPLNKILKSVAMY